VGALYDGHLLPCKVPLGQRFDDVLPEAARWTPADAVRAAAAAPAFACAEAHRSPPRVVVACVDLTKTRRYYAAEVRTALAAACRYDGVVQEMEAAGCALSPFFVYAKIPCGGAEGAPTPLEVNTFFHFVDRVLKQWQLKARADARLREAVPVVLVHCTHGFNRTGAMLAHYSMRRAGAKPELLAALAEFAACRPPGESPARASLNAPPTSRTHARHIQGGVHRQPLLLLPRHAPAAAARRLPAAARLAAAAGGGAPTARRGRARG